MSDPTRSVFVHSMTATAGLETVVHHERPAHPTEVVWSTKNPNGTRELYGGDCHLLTQCTLDDIAHFLAWGHSQCPDRDCTLC